MQVRTAAKDAAAHDSEAGTAADRTRPPPSGPVAIAAAVRTSVGSLPMLRCFAHLHSGTGRLRMLALCLALPIAGCALSGKQKVTYLRAIRLTTPGSAVRLDIVDPGLRVTDMRNNAEGASVYARNRSAALELSAALQAAPAEVTDCRAWYWAKAQQAAGVALTDVQESTYNQFAVLAYTVPASDTAVAGQRNLIACAERDGRLAYLHVSKAAFVPADQLLFDALLSSASLSEGDAAALPVARKFPVPGHGFLECDLPAAWRSWMELSAPGRPPTLSIAPPDGRQWQIDISVLASTDSTRRLRTLTDLHALEEANRDLGLQAGRQATSGVEDFATNDVIGSYYSATRAGELPYVTSGVARTGGLILTFTIGADAPQAPIFAAALRTIGSARQVNPIESGQAPP
jgi:hypothetical protein